MKGRGQASKSATHQAKQTLCAVQTACGNRHSSRISPERPHQPSYQIPPDSEARPGQPRAFTREQGHWPGCLHLSIRQPSQGHKPRRQPLGVKEAAQGKTLKRRAAPGPNMLELLRGLLQQVLRHTLGSGGDRAGAVPGLRRHGMVCSSP